MNFTVLSFLDSRTIFERGVPPSILPPRACRKRSSVSNKPGYLPTRASPTRPLFLDLPGRSGGGGVGCGVGCGVVDDDDDDDGAGVNVDHPCGVPCGGGGVVVDHTYGVDVPCGGGGVVVDVPCGGIVNPCVNEDGFTLGPPAGKLDHAKIVLYDDGAGTGAGAEM